MTEPGPGPGSDSRVRPRLLGPLGWRLLAAFAAVALIAVILLAALAVLTSRGQVSTLVEEQREQRAQAVSTVVADAYVAASGWEGADLTAAETMARSEHAQLVVTDDAGRRVAVAGMGPGFGMGGMRNATGVPATAPVVVDGTTVGTVTLRFMGDTTGDASATQVGDAILRNVGLAALLALAVAVLAAIAVTRFLTKPIVALSAAARAVGTSGPGRHPPLPDAPGELGDLSRTLDEMAATLAREDAVRRAVVADVAHELRTPVTILQASTEEMADGLAEATPERLASLHEEVVRLGRIVEDLGTLAAVDAASIRMERRSVDLAEVARESTERMRDQSAHKAIQLKLDVTPVLVAGDAARLGQAVTNLLTNAVKFTPAKGRVSVTVRRDGSDAVLEVRDTGPGIPDSELPHVFERFWRGKLGAEEPGSGIGLAVVAEVVRAHGGTVEAASPAGGGALLSVRLPASPPA